MSDIIDRIFTSWENGRNVLLYGPPATGKTRLISQIFERLKNSQIDNRGIHLDPFTTNPLPFSRPTKQSSIPQPAKVVWSTFHQSYGYEDFVLGLRPSSGQDGLRLIPWAGIFLDAALELSNSESEYQSVVIFIDEINRGNAAKIFGEFMTFLDFDYRQEGTFPLPLPLRQLSFNNSISEPIKRLNGEEVTIPQEFVFPKNIYIVATMNSVDRAVVPIDSALARRFDRIEMRPNMQVLADFWKLDLSKINKTWEDLSVFETAYRVLEKINYIIAVDLGTEFELGHGMLMSLDRDTPESEAWFVFARLWDEVIYPQIEDRFSGREDKIFDMLKIGSLSDSSYAWVERKISGRDDLGRVINPVQMHKLELETIKRSFQWLIA